MSEFLDFGKNTVFILACYGLSITILAGMVLLTLHARKQAKAKIAELENPSE